MARASCFRALMPEPFDTRFALTGGEGGIFFRRCGAELQHALGCPRRDP